MVNDIQWYDSSQLKYNKCRSSKILCAVRNLNIACLIWSIISIELSLSWNQVYRIYDIKSTGQLIPFVIGLLGLIKFVHAMSVQNSDEQANNAILVGSEPRSSRQTPILRTTRT